jgi:hypothetical protein
MHRGNTSLNNNIHTIVQLHLKINNVESNKDSTVSGTLRSLRSYLHQGMNMGWHRACKAVGNFWGRVCRGQIRQPSANSCRDRGPKPNALKVSAEKLRLRGSQSESIVNEIRLAISYDFLPC